MRTRVGITLTLLALVAYVAWQEPTRPANSPEEIAYKRAHLSAVLTELEAGPGAALSDEQRARRADVLEHLRDYAARGEFPHNTELPAYQLPYFIDTYGTRCALAYAIDRSGEPELVRELAAEDNHAYVAHLNTDPRLESWLTRHGLSIDDAAFIQGPGLIRDGEGRREMLVRPGEEEEPEPLPEDPGNETAENDVVTPPAPSGGTTPGARRPRGGADLGSWQFWWQTNRDAYVSLRGRYHGAKGAQGSARRPADGVVQTQLMPLFGKLSTGTDELRATAIMATALTGRDSKILMRNTLDYLGRPESRYRDLMLLALGKAKSKDASTTLIEIARDSRRGRAVLSTDKEIRETYRAFALLALAETGDGSMMTPVRRLLESTRGRHEDLRAAAITALGMLMPRADDMEREESTALLRKHLKKSKWSNTARAAIPAALMRSGDPDAREDVVRLVGRFRGEREVRAAAALALGTLGNSLQPKTVDALIASARRDPDRQTRRYAALSLGELCLKDQRKELPSKLMTKIRRFYRGTLDGHFKQPGAFEWHVLSAGMFSRRFPDEAAKVLSRMEKILVKGKRRGERTAAAIALGLSGHGDAKVPLRKLAASAKDVSLRGCAVEALGLLGDMTMRDTILKMAKEDASVTIRFQSALALGYLADESVVPELVAALGDARSEQTRAALTEVLGQLGDKRAIDDLVKLAADEANSRAVRERALGALGLIAREGNHSWTLPYRRAASLPLATPSMRTLLFVF